MNKSYSKIRHIEKSNLLLERRILNEYSWSAGSTGTGNAPVYDQRTGKSYDPNVSQIRGYKELYGKDDWWGQTEFDYNKSIDDATHVLLTAMSVVSAFGGGWIGPLVSAGIQLADAGLYYKQGDNYAAGLTALFALIPGTSLISKIPALKKMSTSSVKQLANKLSNSFKTGKKPVLDAVEAEVVEQIGKNSDEISKVVSNTAKEASEKVADVTTKSTLKSLAQTGLQTGKEFSKYAAAYGIYNTTYNTAQQNTPASIVSKEGHDWNKTKLAFGSSGSANDNIQLQSAWKEGWRPGNVVPEKYQTAAYKKTFQEETENLDKLSALIAAAKNSE